MKGYSVHIGVNKVDQNHYLGLQDLRAAVNDANDMYSLATEVYGYDSFGVFSNDKATSLNILGVLNEASGKCEPGDIFLITYSGHGGFLDNIPVENDMEFMDQTWCLYDRQLLDDELFVSFSMFKPNVRILVVSDSCHSGTISKSSAVRTFRTNSTNVLRESLKDYQENHNYLPKRVSYAKSLEIYASNKDFYNGIQKAISARIIKARVEASVLLLAACQDDEVAFDGIENGRFTNALKSVLEGGLTKTFNSPEEIIQQISKFSEYPRPNFHKNGTPGDFLSKGNPFFIKPQDVSLIQVGENTPVIPVVIRPVTEKKPSNQIDISILDDIAFNLPLLFKLYAGTINQISLNEQEKVFTITIPDDKNIRDVINEIAQNADKEKISILVEPSVIENFPVKDVFITKEASDEKGLMPYWPPYEMSAGLKVNWHLDEEHSQLQKARGLVLQKIESGEITEKVRIGHLDTGWYPWHPMLKGNPAIRKDLARSFVKGEEESNTEAEDLVSKGGENQGHGTGTMGLISGGELKFNGSSHGILGAAPFVEIIPIRIAESVMILNDRSFIKAVNYAIEQKCDVITMSMGGKPTQKMAKAINEAYKKGITIVTAAGNSMVKGVQQIGPKKLVYPARFDRVVAACGVCHNHLPYDFDAQEELKAKGSLRFMQGNWGPKEAMRTAMAAYTPNVPWLVSREGDLEYVLSGGGTSSATPQIASAAALWILLNKKELLEKGYSGTWLQVEAVRKALFSTALLPEFEESDKYYGQGILKAHEALTIPVPEKSSLIEAEEASSSLFGIAETLGLFLNRWRALTDVPGQNERTVLEQELQEVLDDLNIKEIDAFLQQENKTDENLAILEKYKEEIMAYELSANLRKTLGF